MTVDVIKPNKEQIEKQEQQEQQKLLGISNRLELSKYTAEVQSRIKKEINSDYILARLEPTDKQAIIEITSNAYFTQRILMRIQKKAKALGIPINTNEQQQLNLLTEQNFDAYMTRLTMTALLNRNIDKNYLIDKLSGVAQELQAEDEKETENQTFMKKVLEKVKNKD